MKRIIVALFIIFSFASSQKFKVNYKTLIFNSVMTYNDTVFRIDSAGNVFVPKGWERIIVIKKGDVWSADSSKKKFSHP